MGKNITHGALLELLVRAEQAILHLIACAAPVGPDEAEKVQTCRMTAADIRALLHRVGR